VIRYALGRFGRPNIPIAPQVLDRIMSLPRTKEILAEPGMAPLPELRRRIGANLSDEEFLLRATMPANLVDAMQSAGPSPRTYDPTLQPVMQLIRALCARRDLSSIVVEKAGFRLALQ
jgi:oxaloacetate decarboxylase alpha subunit